MDVVNSVREYVATWSKGGESECRNTLIAPHCNPSNPSCVDVLTTTYHTLLCSVLLTWSPKYTLSTDAFVGFVQSVLNDLPSTSSATSSNVTIFGEQLVDMMWSVDAELDEVLADAKIALATGGEHGAPNATISELLSKAKKAKQNAELDKETIQVIVKKFLDSGIVNPDFCRERLDSSVLATVGLIADKVSLDKKEIRTRTGLFYKQNKFNLLREQSEGYSKLTAELTSSLGPAHSSTTGRPTESYSAIEDRARPVWEKVISLIGYFDLDPNRALDIILDVLSVHLASHYSFFIALLSFSPWSASYSRPTADSRAMAVDVAPGSFKGKTLDEILVLVDRRRQDIVAVSNGSSPRVLAQVLGFKFAYYHSTEVSEATPKNLYLTAAILIREGFVTLEDLYPHILPSDEDMDQVRKSYIMDVQSRISGAKISQLAMAAPLESNPSSQSKLKASTPVEIKKPVEPKDVNQKVGLLAALLAVGALKPALAILSKFPWLVDARPEIADLMIRIMKLSIGSLYELSMVTKERNPSFNQPRARYTSGGVAYPATRKPILTLWAPTPPSTNTTAFIFFFPDWVERVPICSSLDDLEDVMEPLMKFIGIHVSRDPLFLTKFLRLGRAHLQSTVPIDLTTKKPSGEPDPEHPIRLFWFRILRVYLLPALPLIRGNAVCTVEVWNIIRQYETTSRWRLYGEWKTTIYKSHPELRIRQVQADRESKGILRRLSHNTIDSLSGTVAKLAHSNPCIFFTNAVSQIMAYDNLANVVIQALRYVTNMGFDVLVFIILDALANPNKERLKDDGVNTTDWLQSLASFTGMLFRRYSADLTPVLKYVVHQLHNGQTTELVVLRELIWKMAGIEPLPSLSDSQVAAMAGGPVLRIESVASTTRGARLDPGDAVLKGPQRLGRSLLESSLALPLLIQVAQQRQACVFKAPDTHLKSLASLYDTTHGVLLQYLELLTSPSVIPQKDYATKVLPSIAELGEVYGICAPICMQIIRPVLHASLLTTALAMQEQERIANEEAEKQLKAALTAKREAAVTASRVASPALNPIPLDVVESKPVVEEKQEDIVMEVEPILTASLQAPESPWLPELSALFDDIKRIAPGNAYEVIGPGFYLTFWQLSTYDLSPPAAKYDEEGAALRTLSRQEDSKYIAADRSADRVKRLTASSHRTRRDRYNMFVNTLAQEFKEQTVSRAFTMKRLAREKQHWFAHSTKSIPLVGALIEHCIQPRCLLSPMDADFCAQFIKVLHTQGTPGFHTLMCYDKLLGDHVKVVLFSCSEYEAHNYGRFLSGILSDLYKWHLDEQLYIGDNRTKVGGKFIYNPGLQRTWNKTAALDNLLDWASFQRVLRKWHKKLGKCFTECIQTGEFMHVYNAIIVMKEILPVFPLASVTDTGASLDVAMDRFLETEERGDLKILGRAYSAGLKKREALWTMSKSFTKSPATSTSSPKVLPGSDKGRSNITAPNGPISQPTSTGDGRRSAGQPTNLTPSAPRAQLVNGSSATSDKQGGLSSTKIAMDSIPRPEVVKRVRPEKNSESPKPPGDALQTEPKSSIPSHISELRPSSKEDSNPNHHPRSRYNSPANARDAPIHVSAGGPPHSPRNHRPAEEKSRLDIIPAMPPPIIPSQTPSAQELRETAKMTISRPEKPEARNSNGSGAPSPRNRSPSPSSRPGTRNASSESRASGGRSRSDRGNDGDREERRSDRESRQESRDHAATLGRRDSITHNRSERSGRERLSGRDMDKDGDREKERDRGRDRHGDREKDRDRDRDLDRVRDRERDRDRDRDRDRHRRDDRDRDRDRDNRKERDFNRGQPGIPPVPQDDRALPTRPDPGRHRSSLGIEDGLGKRRRATDDDPERSSKRSSRKDHRDDRGRRPPEKEGHERNRDSDRRRKDRDELGDNDGHLILSDKLGDKRIPEGPSSSSAKVLPLSTPSAPRAMSSSDVVRGKGDPTSGRDRHRDHPNSNGPPPSLGSNNSQSYQDNGPQGPGSLRSRIGDKEHPRSLPPQPSAVNSYRLELQRKDDDRDNRKRTASDRDKDVNDIPLGTSGSAEPMQPPKRPRINRHRYSLTTPSQNQHALAKKLLPIDPLAGDKTRGRKD
ncbi:transcription factor/nuclear export subunit protein 2-domain-containing protein [Collybia nuda]|uniref:THO complex subunit 2 n=1 Tax=Collybia nuda TaxID=64659 RepID=A0A9P6CP42_9AGAR|nr:transcription factor/nuclear export subunit protein 2-domain-containing protein [Collybia nuda]